MGLYNNLHVLGISSTNPYSNNFIPFVMKYAYGCQIFASKFYVNCKKNPTKSQLTQEKWHDQKRREDYIQCIHIILASYIITSTHFVNMKLRSNSSYINSTTSYIGPCRALLNLTYTYPKTQYMNNALKRRKIWIRTNAMVAIVEVNNKPYYVLDFS